MASQQMLLGSSVVDSGTDIYPDDNFRILDWRGDGSSGNQISNGINFKGKTQTGLSGGMVLIKNWETANKDWWAVDTVQGVGIQNRPNKTDAKETHSALITAFNDNGITVGNNSQSNADTNRHQGFCFRKRAKFFDIVTFNGSSSAQTIAHNLGSVPGMMWVKKTNGTTSWAVYHRGLNNGSSPHQYGVKFPPVQESAIGGFWNNTAPTSTHFSVGTDAETGEPGGEYVAYLFAHNEAAFGPNENKTMSYCGYYTGNGSANGPYLNDPGWEPQLLILNRVTGATSHFYVIDNQRGLTGFDGGNDPWMGLTSDGASSGYNFGYFKNGGFKIVQSNADINASGSRYIYYMVRAQDGVTSPAIPEAGTDVFHAAMGHTSNSDVKPQHKTNFKVSFGFYRNPTAGESWGAFIRGEGAHDGGRYLRLNSDSGEAQENSMKPMSHEGFIENESNSQNDLAIAWKESSGFRRYIYSGTSSFANHDHSMGGTPEMMWVKAMSFSRDWTVYHKDMWRGNSSGLNNSHNWYIKLNSGAGRVSANNQWNGDPPTSQDFTVGNSDDTNKSGHAYVCLMWRSIAGISKVSYYTGNGSTSGPSVSLGFAPRFIMIKRADGNGDWRVLTSARGFDKSLLFNGTSSESTTNYLTTDTTSFTLTSSATDVNASSGDYIYYAHA